MKRPAMNCLLHRKRIHEAIDRNDTVPIATLEHCADCASCREVLNEQQNVDRILREASTYSEREAAPEWLFTRIRACTTDATGAIGTFWSVRRVLGGGLAVAATLLVMTGLWQLSRSPDGEPSSVPIAGTKDHPPRSAFENSVFEVLSDNPLETEMEHLREDTRAALDFLAANFVPGQRVESRNNS